jgi:translation initiation factor IF-1
MNSRYKIDKGEYLKQPRADVFEIKGTVTEALPNTMFRVQVTEGKAEMIGRVLLCTLTGNMRRFSIRVLPGDAVLADVSVYDTGRARITRRLREGDLIQSPRE